MLHRTRTLRCFPRVVSLALLLSACNGRAASPITPDPLPGPPTPAVTYSVSGTVTEMTSDGPAPVEGAQLVRR